MWKPSNAAGSGEKIRDLFEASIAHLGDYANFTVKYTSLRTRGDAAIGNADLGVAHRYFFFKS